MRGLRKLRDGGAANADSADARPRGRRLVRRGVLAVGLAGGLAACGGSSDDDSAAAARAAAGRSTSSPTRRRRPSTRRSIIPAFQETPEGEGVEFSSSFGSSGDQSRAVEAGQPADFVHLPLEPDITRLVDAGLVAEDWSSAEYDGGIQNSVVVVHHAPGQPEGHHRTGMTSCATTST